MDVKGEVFQAYAFTAGILVVKVILMSFLTAINRFKNHAFANPEDVVGQKNLKVTTSDPDVERVRRAHLNDLENVIPFLIIGLLYTVTNPSAAVAGLLFKIYTGTRIAHSIVYAIYPIRQPARVLAWFIGVFIQLYMAFKVIGHFS